MPLHVVDHPLVAHRVAVLRDARTGSAAFRRCPDVDIVVAALDPGLDERAFIVPGLGDAGDRLYGRV
ncbi:MAG: uracil phosphoribosyltransferase [Acidimicrobiales bacterium]